MSKIDTQNINVLNYNENEVFVNSAKEHYKFNASRDGKTPAVIPMPLSEVQNISSNTDIIITGWLTFDDDVKEDIFKELRIPNWKDILTNEDIENILTHPTIDGLQKIIDIENLTYFDRVRMIMFKLINNGIDITTKVNRIVNQRYNELQNRQRKSRIILTKKDTSLPDDKVRELSEQNASLQSQLDEMKKMMEKMMEMQKITTTSSVESKNETVKKSGRPSSKKTS